MAGKELLLQKQLLYHNFTGLGSLCNLSIWEPGILGFANCPGSVCSDPLGTFLMLPSKQLAPRPIVKNIVLALSFCQCDALDKGCI